MLTNILNFGPGFIQQILEAQPMAQREKFLHTLSDPDLIQLLQFLRQATMQNFEGLCAIDNLTQDNVQFLRIQHYSVASMLEALYTNGHEALSAEGHPLLRSQSEEETETETGDAQ